MAKTTLSHPFDSMSGKLGSTDKIIMRTRNGRTHAYVVKHPYKGPLAPSRQKAVSSFAEAVKQTSVIMNTPELRSEWEEKYADYRKKADRYPNTHPNPYTTFRGFIIGSLIHASMVRRSARATIAAMRRQSELNGNAEMSLQDINTEIQQARLERKTTAQ